MTSIKASEQVLENLLLESRIFSCEYENALSNHLPMALIALQKIGASENQLTSFYDLYSPQLEKAKEDQLQIDTKNWRQYLGQHAFNLSYRNFFIQEIEQKGQQAVLETYLPELMPGVSGAAFHPLIRLAYGLEVQNNWEIAEALASWCMAYQELGVMPTNSGPLKSLTSSLEELGKEIERNPVQVSGETVFAWFKCVAESQAFKNFFSQAYSMDLSLSQIADLCLRLYLSTNDSFTALHCVTATHALRKISPYLKDSSLNGYLWQAVCTTYVIVKCPTLKDTQVPPELPSWQEIFEAARNQTNDHVIKFVHTTHSESENYRNPLYQLAAAKKTGLLVL